MKFILIVCSFFLMAVMTNAAKMKRQNTAATAYPTVPPFINTLTSNLFQRGNISGESAIYQFLSNLSSMVYPAIANATFNVLYSLNPVLAGISSNIYYGLCAPPTPYQGTTGPTLPPLGTVIPPTGNIILSLLPLLLGGLSGNKTTPGTTPTMSPPTNPLASILPVILGPLIAGLSGGGQNGSNPLSGLSGGGNPNDPLAFLRGVIGTNGFNGTFNLPDAAFIQLLANIGQTPQSLQNALQMLGQSVLQFINGYTGLPLTVQQYLSQIFSQAAAATTAMPGTPSTGSLGSLNDLLNSLGQALASLG